MLNFFDSVSCETIIAENEAYEQVLAMVRLLKKKFLLEFIEENELDVVWTVLGEKQKITGGFGRDFPRRAEFSYTYYINEKEEVSRNHKVYNIMEAGRY